ncbi:MAG: substrate-binding domain-containing protein [Chitinophagaceae bacterium]
MNLGSCQSNKNQFRIGFSQCTGEDGWRRSQLEEMRMELAFHPNITFLYKDAHGNSQKQVQQIHELLASHIDALIVSPNEAAPLTPIVNEVYQMGIPVIVVDRKTNSSLYSAFVGADNQEIGFLAGQYIAHILQGKGNIVEIQGLPGSTPAIERHEGFIRAIKNYPGLHILEELHTDWTEITASQQLERTKTIASQANLVFAHNDIMAHAAYKMYRLWGLKSRVKFIGVDAQPGPKLGISMVSRGILTATVLYPTGGKEAIRIAVKALHKQFFGKNILLRTLVIDSSNVGLMKLQTDKLLSQEKDIERQQKLISAQAKIYQNQKNFLFILLITLIIAMLLGSIAYFSFRRNKRITKSLKLKNNEILFQQNVIIEYSNKAKVATEAKLDFFTNISHELRTPLTLIFGAIEEISENKRDAPIFKNQILLIRKNAARLFRMVNQLIDYRKVEVEKMKLIATENDMVGFLEEIIGSFKGLAQKRNIDLQFKPATSKIPMWFDGYMIDMVFFNLITNALKFTEDYGRIYVSIRYGDDKKNVIIDFDDTGSGISPHEAEHIFDLFYQGKNSMRKGFGLGLPLAKEFIRLHHGSISLVNKKQPGAIFSVVLPVGKDYLLPEEVKEQTATVNHDREFYNSDDLLYDHTEFAIYDQNNSKIIRDLSILIIEDNEELLNFLGNRLGKNFEVHLEKDGNSGIKCAFECIPDLIICDIGLPSKDGLNLTQMLKSNIRTSHIPVILLTAHAREEQQIQGIQAMADYYIVKPFSLNFLEVVIKTLIKNRETLREHYSSDCNLEIKQEGPGKLDRRFLNELNAFIDERISDEKLNVEEICKNMGISRIPLYRKVKALLGCSVNDFILNKRLTKAKFILSQEGDSIATVAYKVGFSTPSYFSTAFKKKFNISPKEFKEMKK